MLTVGKPVSLVQQKKQQWAQEREEMSNLYLPWGSGERYKNRLSVRNQFASSLDLHNQASYEYQEPIRRQRSPSLPPIYNIDHERTIVENTQRNKGGYNRNMSSVKRFSFYDEDAEGDTSGYGSETVNHMNIKNQCRKFYSNPNNQNDVVVAWQEEKDVRKQPSNVRSNVTDGALSARSQSGPEEGRPRWGDRGVATGRLWEPTAPTERLPQMQNHKKGTPSWVERGLNMIDSTSDVLVFDQTRISNSGLDCDHSSYNGSDEGRTFLRGQNAPIEPEIKAQRENKRIKALELQSAILSQLEEQEKRREEERIRKLKEERLEELRIQRQQEEDRIRLEEEKRKNLEKQTLEQRKLDTLKKALEEAERKAKQEKEKRFNCLRRNGDANLSSETIPQTIDNNDETRQSSPNKTLSPTKSNRTYNVPTTATSQTKENSRQTTAFNSPRSIAPSSLNLYIHNIQPLALADNQFNILPIGITGSGDIVNNQTASNIQLAVLVPQNLKQTGCCDVSLNSFDINNESNNIDRLLTPRKYRNMRIKDASTQTDMYMCTSSYNHLENEESEKIIYKDYTNIDENAPSESNRITLKRERRLRSEERYKKEIENRPKWGANKPIAQYKKQSEKDPFYVQKRKIRQKYRPQVRPYISQSSEDSRSPSPPLRHEKFGENHNKTRNSISQFFWRNKRNTQDISQINSNESLGNKITDISSLSYITNEKKSPKLSFTKRLTLSQKFINDKYGSRKLWTEETNEKKNNSDIDKKFEKSYVNKKEQNCELNAEQNKNYKTKL